MSTVELSAHELRPGMTVEVHPREWVTLAEVKDQGAWVTNAAVYLTAEDGHRYGLKRYDRVRVQEPVLADQITAAAEVAQSRKAGE